ncbi:MAG: carboxymuconolactone decarboxylase family protein [Polyangiaceae bacterium]
MTRIAPLEPPYDDRTAELLAKMMPPGVEVPPLAVFRSLARLPELGARLAAVGGALLRRQHLPLPLSELAILRTTARCGAEYEWGVHATWLGAAAGLDAEALDATRAPVSEGAWSPAQAAVLHAVDALVEEATLSDAIFAGLREHLDDDAILELLVLVGFYHLISFVVRGAALPPEPWAARFDTR